MEWYEIVIIVFAVLFVVFVFVKEIWKKKHHISCCGGQCSHCKAGQNECPACHIKKDLQEYTETK